MGSIFCQGCRLIQRTTNTKHTTTLWRGLDAQHNRQIDQWRGIATMTTATRRAIHRPSLTLLPFRGLTDLSRKESVSAIDIRDVLINHNLVFNEGHTGYLTTCKHCGSKESASGVPTTTGDVKVEGRRGARLRQLRRRARHKEADATAAPSVSVDQCNTGSSELPLFIGLYTGDCLCLKCGVKSDWETFKRQHGDEGGSGVHSMLQQIVPKETVYANNPTKHTAWTNTAPMDETTYLEAVSNHSDLQNTPLDALQKFGVRCCSEGKTLVFPYFDAMGENVVGFKVRNGNLASGGGGGIIKMDAQLNSCFGWQVLKKNNASVLLHNESVVVTDSEISCIAISAATGHPTLSLPCGVASLPPGCLPFLEGFREIILWFRDDDCGGIASKHVQRLARKLNLSRCSFVSCEDGEPGQLDRDAIRRGLHHREPMSHDHIVTFQNLRTQVFSVLRNAKENAGVQFKRFRGLNDCLGGHRLGELTVITGATGTGKTTFMSELSLDLCMSGVKTLWGSFEVKNTRLVKTMLHQFSGLRLEHHMERVGEWASRFEELPLYFMNYYGTRDIDEVLATIKYAVYMYDIEHVVIDNLQFMVHVRPHGDKFQAMDEAIAKFRSCASEHGVHITVSVDLHSSRFTVKRVYKF